MSRYDYMTDLFRPADYRDLIVRCPECKGRRTVEVMSMFRLPLKASYEATMGAVAHIGVGACVRCKGSGRVSPTIPKRIEIREYIRDGDGEMIERLVGTVPSPDLQVRPHPLVSMRPGDYTPKVNDKAELYFIASRMLGIGDIQALSGFIPGEADTDAVQKHIDFCKRRAYAYCDKDDLHQAHASFTSDMMKNEFTAQMQAGHESLMLLMSGEITTVQQYRKWLEKY